MFASVLEFRFKPEALDQGIEFARSLRPELEQLDGLKQFIVIKTGEDTQLGIVIYESQAQQEAATPRAREIMGRMADMLAAPPERKGCEVVVNEVI